MWSVFITERDGRRVGESTRVSRSIKLRSSRCLGSCDLVVVLLNLLETIMTLASELTLIFTRPYLQWRRQCSKGARSFRGQKILKPGHPESGVRGIARILSVRVHFSLKKLDDLFSRRPQLNTGRQRRWLFHCRNKTNKAVRYGDIFIFFVHTITEAKQQAGRSQGGGSSSQVIWPCAPWCSATTAYFISDITNACTPCVTSLQYTL